jgi:hypothetical protein
VRSQQAAGTPGLRLLPPLPPPRHTALSLPDATPLCVDLGDTTSPPYQTPPVAWALLKSHGFERTWDQPPFWEARAPGR